MQISELELKLMAKEASTQYVDKKTPMNATITKMAEDKKLNPHQVARVCEHANLSTYNHMWDKTGSGDFTFEMADQDQIAEKLSSSFSPILDEYTPGSNVSELLPGAEDVKRIEKDIDKANKTASANLEKVASVINAEPEVSKTKLRKLAGQMRYYISEIDSAIFESDLNKKEAGLKLRDMLKTAALRGENIASALAAAITAFPEKKFEIKQAFTGALKGLDTHGIDFAKFAKTYSEDATGAKAESTSVVNKNHPILKHISTILDADELTPKLEKTKEYLVKKVEILDSKITNKKFDNE